MDEIFPGALQLRGVVEVSDRLGDLQALSMRSTAVSGPFDDLLRFLARAARCCRMFQARSMRHRSECLPPNLIRHMSARIQTDMSEQPDDGLVVEPAVCHAGRALREIA